MTLRTLKAAVCGAMLATVVTASFGDVAWPAPRCELRRPMDFLLGTRERTWMDEHPLHLLRVCTALDRPTSYRLVSTPTHSSAGVCRFTEQDADRPDRAPQDFAAVTSGPCPAQDPTAYLFAAGVPDAVLVRLVAFRRDMASSDAAFDQALQGFEPPRRGVQGQGYETFRRKTLAGELVFDGALSGEYLEAPKGSFVMEFGDPADTSTRWTLTVQPTSERLVVQAFAEGAAD